jgi:hypothetical protein
LHYATFYQNNQGWGYYFILGVCLETMRFLWQQGIIETVLVKSSLTFGGIMKTIKPHSNAVRLFYFWAGIIATFLYRAIIVTTDLSTFWTKVFWYVGTVGFILYFAHRFQVSEKREHLIVENELDKKIAKLKELDENDRAAMEYIFKTLVSSKERWNYIFIFVTSGIALLIGIYLDFLR